MVEEFGLTNNLDDYRDIIWDDRNNPELFMHGGSIERYTFNMRKIYTGNSSSDFPVVYMDVYVPENVNPNTPIVTFFPGGGNSADYYSGTHVNGYESIVDYLQENGSDCIVVMPSTYDGLGAMAKYTPDMVDMVCEKYGISSNNFMWSGHSMGTAGALYGVANYINQSTDVELAPQVCFLIDNYAHEYGSMTNKSGNELAIFNDTKDALVKNGTIVVDFTVWKDQDDNPQLLYMYAEAGVNVLKIEIPDDYPLPIGDRNGYTHDGRSGFNIGHYAARQAFFEAKFYEFYAGLGPLPDSFIYKIYDETVGDFVEIDRSLIDTPEKLHAFFGNEYGSKLDIKINFLKSLQDVSITVSSDKNVLEANINGVLGKIRTSNFVQNNISFDGGFSSDTSVPSQIPGVVSSFFDSNATFLVSLANDMNAIAQIGASIEELDNYLASLAGDLDPDGIPNEHPGNTPSEEPEEEPTEPEGEPTEPEGEPTEPEGEPTEPEGEPTEPEGEPTEPEGEPTEPEGEPTEPEDGVITEEGGITGDEGEFGDYVTEEGESEKPNTLGYAVDKDGDKGNQPNNNPNNTGGDKSPSQEPIPTPTPSPNSEPTPTPAPSPTPSPNPEPTPTPAPSPTPTPAPQPPQNNPGIGNAGIGSDSFDNSFGNFPEYSDVYSNDNMIVYNYNDEYKVVVHIDGDKIIGIEHYYDFGNEINADHALDGLMEQYSSIENFENIVQSDRYVKVLFDSDMYENMSINDIRKQYFGLNEVIK